MKTSEAINELAKAMSAAQKDIKPAAKDGANPHFKSKYFTISSAWDSIRQPLTENGLTIWQDVVTGEKSVSVMTRVVHNSGQWVEFGPLSIPLMKFDAQAIGSATSYAKRYALCAAMGVVSDEEDDDGEKAVARNYKPNVEPRPTLQQVNEMTTLLKECSENYFDAVMKGISQRGWNGIADMSLEAYNNLRTNALMKRAEHIGSMTKVTPAEQEQQVDE